MHTRIGCICLTFLHCGFSNVSSKRSHRQWLSYICYICLTFRHCVFSNVSSNHLPERMHNHIGCICLSFLHCVFSNASSNCLPERMHRHTGCICFSFLRCVFSNALSMNLDQKKHSCTGCISLTSVQPALVLLQLLPQNSCLFVRYCLFLFPSARSHWHCFVVQGFEPWQAYKRFVSCASVVSNWTQINIRN